MTSLGEALDDLDAAVVDLQRSSFTEGSAHLARIVQLCDAEPLRGLLDSFLPPFELADWYLRCARGETALTSGGVRPEWSADSPERIACQLSLTREAVRDDNFKKYMYTFTAMRPLNKVYADTLNSIVVPMARDIRKLADRRVPPPGLAADLKGGFPKTSNIALNALLEEARQKFLDKSPTARRDGLEKLWDAWEMLTTFYGDKPKTIQRLLSEASGDPAIQKVLSDEADALRKIGNDFQIRHFGAGKHPIAPGRDVDFLFHRMTALIFRLLPRQVA